MPIKRHPFARRKEGDFCAVEIGERKYGYVRMVAGWAFMVLPVVSTGLVNNICILKKYTNVKFFDLFSPTVDPTRIIYLGHLDFEREEDRWPPPRYYEVSITNSYRIYARGRIRHATEKEIEGLEIAICLTPASLKNFIISMESQFAKIEGEQKAKPKPGRRRGNKDGEKRKSS